MNIIDVNAVPIRTAPNSNALSVVLCRKRWNQVYTLLKGSYSPNRHSEAALVRYLLVFLLNSSRHGIASLVGFFPRTGLPYPGLNVLGRC